MKHPRQPVIVPILRFLGARTPVPMWERFAMWSLVIYCAFAGGDGNHFTVGALVAWWPFGR